MTPSAKSGTPTWNGRMLDFVSESNRIEGIVRPVTTAECEAHKRLWALDFINVAAMEEFVTDVAAGPLRRARGQDVYVGDYVPPSGGPGIERRLESLLLGVYDGVYTPYEAHVAYETLHPFLDGNGRSGRALWAWQMLQEGLDPFRLGFLHTFYYQTLSAASR